MALKVNRIDTVLGVLPNIEKSAFCKGEYVGYGRGHCWAIVKINSACGKWQASVPKDRSVPLIFAKSLFDLSNKLL